MILIADSGSTKTDWRLIVAENEARSYSTSGLNPYFVNSDEITCELEKELVPFISNNKVRAVFFYGAGCAVAEKTSVVEDGLRPVFPNADIYIFSDLLGAARALCNRNIGLVCILGTGSNSCCFDGNNIVANVPSLGFMLGDEGSGAYMGKALLKGIFSEKAPTEIIELFKSQFPQTKAEILNRIYHHLLPNRYLASFSIFIFKHRDHQYMHELVKNAFADFFEQNILCYSDYQKYPLHFTGSIAFHFQDILRECAIGKGLEVGTVIKSPVENLIPFHLPDLKKYASLFFYEHE